MIIKPGLWLTKLTVSTENQKYCRLKNLSLTLRLVYFFLSSWPLYHIFEVFIPKLSLKK